MKLRTIISIIIIPLFAYACKQVKITDEVFYEKEVIFDINTPLEEKVKMAAHLVPTKQQLDWQELEMTAFIHFSINTYTDLEWGHGDESPDIFKPVDFDARQWVKAISDGGMKMIILTCKHHDGFCLWPTKTSNHSVASSPWKNGKGDIVRAVKEACDEYGLKFGVYLSPWDRNAESYGDSLAYNTFFMEQLTELLTWYGKVDEVWFDGACGEGPNGKKQVYDWESYYKLISRLQPLAVTAIMGEDIRWVGTESGYGRETEWSVTAMAPGGARENLAINKRLGIGATDDDLGSENIIKKTDKLFWYPAEVDVSIRPGWFYHKSQDNKVKSLAKLVDIYFSSVGRNAVLLLNIPPDTRGLIHENDVARLAEFKEFLDKTFESNIAYRAFTKYKNARKSVDGDKNSYLEITELPAEIEYKFPIARDFNVFMIQEYITKGQRIESFSIEAFIDDQWQEISNSTTVGYKKLLRFDRINTDKIKLIIKESRYNPLISEIGVYNSPDILSDPKIIRNKQGVVSISCESPDLIITYTTDGSDPTQDSEVFTQSFNLASGGTVKARSFLNNFESYSNVITMDFDIAPTKWEVVEFSDQVDDYPATNAIDGDPNTMWHTAWTGAVKAHPHSVTVDMGETHSLSGFTYTPRSDENKSGTVAVYSLYLSINGRDWSRQIPNGHFNNISNNPVKQYVRFYEECQARYIRFVTHQSINGEAWSSVGEIGILTD